MSAGTRWPLDGDGVWRQIASPPLPGRPCLFLDRDGVVVEDVGWLRRAEDVRLLPGIAALIAAANRAGVAVAVITNQSGIGRGLFGWRQFDAVQRAIAAALAPARWDAVFAAPFPPGEERMRKPAPGMLLAAAEALALDVAASWMLGDRASDMEAARRAGAQGGILIGQGCGSDDVAAALALAGAGFRVLRAATPGAARRLLPFLAGAPA